MVLNDARRSAELVQRVETQASAAPARLDVPQALEHELQVRRFDAAFVGLVLDASASRAAEVDAASGHLVQDCVDELRLDLDRRLLRAEPVVLANWPDDRGLARATVESVEPERVREQIRNPPLERVELSERVLADAEEEVRAQTPPPERLGQVLHQGARPALALVVEEVLLELVEYEVEVRVEPSHDAAERIGQGVGASNRLARVQSILGCIEQVGDGITSPGRRHDHNGFGLLSQPLREARAEERRLADAARAVEDREPIGHEVRDDHLDLALAPEEERRVVRRVLERCQPLERHRRLGGLRLAHVGSSSPAYSARVATQRSNGISSTSTSRRRQNSRSSGCASAWTAQER